MSTAAETQDGFAAIAGPCHSPVAEALSPLITAIEARHGTAVSGIIFYGSCLRSGRIHDGLVDLYVVVDNYRAAHDRPISALANRLVPPNVYYLEADGAQGLLRCKYAVIDEAELARGCTTALLSSIWGRFAQPVAIVTTRDADTRTRFRAHLGRAVATLLDECLPALSDTARAPAEAFAEALALSYSGELRTEDSRRSTTVIDTDRAEYARRLHAARGHLAFDTEIDSTGRFRCYPSMAQKRRAARRWRIRRPLGRALSVARLSKACFTFGNAVDYGAWKLARHTGVEIEVTDRLRRHPLIYGWPVLWRLYRRGLLR
ncbi:hypothetical protein [Salinisphaera sp. Q1T1-3]|uniref:hypothetical protein n=1 Tax=Salinisphaera sp. Q1T1-3 TaxID=2321229 RepID=UPI000E76FE3B|nr:hypothetical protein [Salinisphaera sp. Q1T1-3]RJS92218.1 hypothetical protein D3260_12570 [Salinisphaera sp. Q1T1-3]